MHKIILPETSSAERIGFNKLSVSTICKVENKYSSATNDTANLWAEYHSLDVWLQ